MYEKTLQRCIDEFDYLRSRAGERRDCKRKSVACSIVGINKKRIERRHEAFNGPSRVGHECTGVVGGCGCSHAEPRAVMQALESRVHYPEAQVLFCLYSPCTNCANIILDSGKIHGCVYDILTEHDVRGAAYLQASMPVLTREDLVQAKLYSEVKRPNPTRADMAEAVSAAISKWYLHS